MSRIASADTAAADVEGGFAAGDRTVAASSLADTMTGALEEVQDALQPFGSLAIRKVDAATRERITLLLKARLECACSDVRYEESFDPKSDAAARFARIVREAERDIAACELAAIKAVGWSDEEIAEIVLRVAANAMLSTLDRLGEAGFPSQVLSVRAS